MSGFFDMARVLLGYQKIKAPYEEILSGPPAGRTTERVRGRRISRRRYFHAPHQWHPVFTYDPKTLKIVDEHWGRDR